MLDSTQAPLAHLGAALPVDSSPFKLTDAILSLWGAVSVQATYWHVYLAVILAYLAFMMNNWSKPKHSVAVAGLAAGMVVFFAASCYQIYVLQDRANQWRLAIHQYVGSHSGSIQPEFLAVYSIEPSVPPAWTVAVLHLLVDIALLALLAYNYHRFRTTAVVIANGRTEA